MAASPLPSQGPKEGGNATQRQAQDEKSEVVPNTGKKKQKWLPYPCLLGGPKKGGNAMSPLHDWGSPTPSAGRKIRSGPQQRGAKLEVVASALPSWRPRRGRKCYVPPKFSGIPNAKCGADIQKCFSTKGNKIGSGCLNPAFSGGQNRAVMRRHPCILGGSPTPGARRKIRSGPEHRGKKTEVVALPLPT